MAESKKIKKFYIDSNAVVHKRELLSDILDKGVIADTVTNENGTAIKFSNGIMICTIKKTYKSLKIENIWGALYQTSIAEIFTFPVAFIDIPNVQATNSVLAGATPCLLIPPGIITKSDCSNIVAVHPNSVTVDFDLNIMAIGRWK